jgi:hypothetical protein
MSDLWYFYTTKPVSQQFLINFKWRYILKFSFHIIHSRARHSHKDEVEQPKKRSKPSIECEICHKAVQNITTHKQAFHEEMMPVQCSLCPKMCNTKSILLGHMRRHEMARRGKTFQCNLCSATFYNNGHVYRKHMRMHTGNWLFFFV